MDFLGQVIDAGAPVFWASVLAHVLAFTTWGIALASYGRIPTWASVLGCLLTGFLGVAVVAVIVLARREPERTREHAIRAPWYCPPHKDSGLVGTAGCAVVGAGAVALFVVCLTQQWYILAVDGSEVVTGTPTGWAWALILGSAVAMAVSAGIAVVHPSRSAAVVVATAGGTWFVVGVLIAVVADRLDTSVAWVQSFLGSAAATVDTMQTSVDASALVGAHDLSGSAGPGPRTIAWAGLLALLWGLVQVFLAVHRPGPQFGVRRAPVPATSAEVSPWETTGSASPASAWETTGGAAQASPGPGTGPSGPDPAVSNWWDPPATST